MAWAGLNYGTYYLVLLTLQKDCQMRYGICSVSLMPVRAKADHRAEMVNQLLFGETFSILEAGQKWYYIRGILDGYEGWVSKPQCTLLDEALPESYHDQEYVVPDLMRIRQADTPGDSMMILPGSSLPGLKQTTGEFSLGGTEYIVDGEIMRDTNPNKRDRISRTATRFLNAPYLWGGRSLYGIDCSGFVQVVYKICGIVLPRDAGQQVKKGKAINFVSESGPGDLAFFGETDEEISHVGIILEGGRIIHASGRVRIDKFDHQGIFSTGENEYSHALRVIHNYLA